MALMEQEKGGFMRKVQVRESGRTMSEMLATLVVMGVLTIGGVVGIKYAMEVHKENESIDWVVKTIVGSRTGFLLERYGEKAEKEKDVQEVPIAEVISGVPFNAAPGVEVSYSYTTPLGSEVSVDVINKHAFEVDMENVSYGVCTKLLNGPLEYQCAYKKDDRSAGEVLPVASKADKDAFCAKIDPKKRTPFNPEGNGSAEDPWDLTLCFAKKAEYCGVNTDDNGVAGGGGGGEEYPVCPGGSQDPDETCTITFLGQADKQNCTGVLNCKKKGQFTLDKGSFYDAAGQLVASEDATGGQKCTQFTPNGQDAFWDGFFIDYAKDVCPVPPPPCGDVCAPCPAGTYCDGATQNSCDGTCKPLPPCGDVKEGCPSCPTGTTCMDATNQSCGSQCCPNNRECGSVCCAEGQTCDPDSMTCRTSCNSGADCGPCETCDTNKNMCVSNCAACEMCDVNSSKCVSNCQNNCDVCDANSNACVSVAGILTCGESCCDESTTACVGGTCCPSAQICGNTCCASHQSCQTDDNGQQFCEDICSAESNETFCDGTCCASHQRCDNGQCVDACDEGMIVCGDVCCPSGATCSSYGLHNGDQNTPPAEDSENGEKWRVILGKKKGMCECPNNGVVCGSECCPEGQECDPVTGGCGCPEGMCGEECLTKEKPHCCANSETGILEPSVTPCDPCDSKTEIGVACQFYFNGYCMTSICGCAKRTDFLVDLAQEVDVCILRDKCHCLVSKRQDVVCAQEVDGQKVYNGEFPCQKGYVIQ